MDTKETVLITGIGGPAGRSAAAYFAAKGFRVVGTDIRQVDDANADDFMIVPPAADAGYYDAITALVGEVRPAIFIPTVTEELVKAAEMKEDVERLGVDLYISPSWAVSIANDKLKTARYLASRGLAVPRTIEGGAPADEVAEALGFPLIAKPAFGRGGRGVVVHRDMEGLSADRRGGIIFQEFIPGDEYDVNLFVAPDGECTAVTLKKTELKEGIVGNALKVERASCRPVEELATAAARAMELRGPLDMDIRMRSDGAPSLLEINARVGGNVLHAAEVLDRLVEAHRAGRAAAARPG